MVVLLAVQLVDQFLLAVGQLVRRGFLAVGLVLMVLLAVQLVLLRLGAGRLEDICHGAAFAILGSLLKTCGNVGSPGKGRNLWRIDTRWMVSCCPRYLTATTCMYIFLSK